jgi:hypothetical protein
MGRNVLKCIIFLFNIPEDAVIPEFTSIAWSYDSQGLVKGSIAVVVMRRENATGALLCFNIPNNLREDAPQHIKDILVSRKYLGVSTNAQLDGTEGKEKLIKKLNQRIGLVSTKASSISQDYA